MASDIGEVRDETERLGAQRRLLEQALAVGLKGQQHRVQTALLADTLDDLVVAERAVQAIEAGWEPFTPSAEWLWGYVEDPRFLRGRAKLASGLMAVPLAALGGALLALRWDLLPAGLMAAVLLLGLQAAIYGVLGRVAEEWDRRRLGEADTGLRMFNAPMPAHALTAYRRARESGLFDTFVVHSPRAQDFCAVSVAEAPSIGLLDPVLAGRIGRRSFLIAQWDLAADLAEV